ncbi:GGDEF domain-containing protein [Methylorubrum zatmanii]|uniref:diguanylate cyclase n=1 Tax=Methylorubrum zatmanii TaxID=29429 RepID=A0ABW1WLA3_9HYPH|nr:GGDEF domain-containing protein [Methylorubrum zatmanii]MBD8907729.1 GGDEF domain-containing protein [Methylorubrum zatmanii]
MRQGPDLDRERSLVLAQRSFELMRDYCTCANPRAYAVWYLYVAGTQPLMNDAIKRLTTQNGVLTSADIDQLHDAYIDGRRIAAEVDRMNSSLIAEVEGIMEIIEVSIRSTAQYGESLQAFSHDIANTATSRTRLREIVTTIIANTRDVTANNRTLEARMRESRSEIEQLRETLEAARLESLTDALTGLGNRKSFEEALHRTVNVPPAPGGTGKPTSLIVLDIDYFKRFNDLYGHLTGDQVLRLVAIVMREHVVQAGATLARFGGEEFGIVLPETDLEEARAVAERVRTSVTSRELVKRSTGESLGKVTVSLGIATQHGDDNAVSLLERADACLFAAKRAGRDRTLDETEVMAMRDVA